MNGFKYIIIFLSFLIGLTLIGEAQSDYVIGFNDFDYVEIYCGANDSIGSILKDISKAAAKYNVMVLKCIYNTQNLNNNIITYYATDGTGEYIVQNYEISPKKIQKFFLGRQDYRISSFRRC